MSKWKKKSDRSATFWINKKFPGIKILRAGDSFCVVKSADNRRSLGTALATFVTWDEAIRIADANT